MQELLYTSVPRGLKPGSRGFCTVLSTQGMVAPLAAALEGLSGYRPVFPLGHERVAENPIVYSHLKLQVAGKSWHVLSRIADYGLDYSQRTNKLAHHLVLDKSELPAAGPASLLRVAGIMRESWEGDPKIVPPKPISRQPSAPSGVCQAWKEMTGDAGWAGVLAESFLKDPNRPVILLFEPGQDLRPLMDESLSLLPPERRWDVTFSTYFTGSSQGITCLWRGIAVGSKEASESLRFVNALRIDLTSADFSRAEGGELVDAARKGIRPAARPTPPSKQAAPRDQQQPPVVVTDDAEQPTVYRSHFEEPSPEPRAVPIGSHDHSQAPPRLTPSVFKFANARKQPDSDDSTARTSTGRKSVIILGLILLLGSAITAGVFLISKLTKDPHVRPTNTLASNDAPQTPAASGVDEGGGSASKSAVGVTTNRPKLNTPSSSEDANTIRPPEPPTQSNKPATYTITLDPPNAKLTSDDVDVEVLGEGQQRTVKVAKPDSKQVVTLIARLDGYQELRRELKLEPAQPNPFPMVLVPNNPPAGEKKPAEQPSPSDAPKLLALPKVDSTDDTVIHEFVPPLPEGQSKKLTWLSPKSDKFNSFSGRERDGTLVLFHKQQNEDVKVGVFSVRDSKVFFSWDARSDVRLREEAFKKARFCAMQLIGGGQAKSIFVFRDWSFPPKDNTPAEFKSAQIKLISDPKSVLARVLKDADDLKISCFAKEVVIGFDGTSWPFERGKDGMHATTVECEQLAKKYDQEHVRIGIDINKGILTIVAKASELDGEKKSLGARFNSKLEEECKKHQVKAERKFWFNELKDEKHTKIKTEIHNWFYNECHKAIGDSKTTDERMKKLETANRRVEQLENETMQALSPFFDEAKSLKARLDSAPENTKKINTTTKLKSVVLAFRIGGEGVELINADLVRFVTSASDEKEPHE